MPGHLDLFSQAKGSEHRENYNRDTSSSNSHTVMRPTTASSSAEVESEDQAHLADTIKSFHYHLQQKLSTSASGLADEPAEVCWSRLLAGEDDRLRCYATAMHGIATRYWDAGGTDFVPSAKRPRDSGAPPRHNDRVRYSLDCVADYYLGRAPGQLPRLALRGVKEWRRAFFAANGRPATDGEVRAAAEDWLRAAPMGSAAAAAAAAAGALCGTAALPSGKGLSLQALDVGSCYGPFIGRDVTNGALRVPLEVSVLDLSPYEGSGVLRGDWLAARFVSGPPMIRAGDEGIDVARSAFDVVFFCLLLSFLPHPRLRYLACLHARLALKDGGLLVVVSTRTQGARRSAWIDEWIECIEGIGFERVHKNVMSQLVGMSFCASGQTGDDVSEWIANMMARPEASTGLRTVGDGGI